MKKINFSISFLSVLAVFILMASVVMAQAPVGPALPPYVPAGDATNLAEIEGILDTIAIFLIYISLVIAVIYIIWAGIIYMSAGSNSTKATEARQKLINGIIGAAIVMAIGVILNTIDALITRDFFA